MTGSPRDTPGPVIEYRRLEAPVALPDDVLCAVTFGARSESVDDPRCVRVGLEPLAGGGLVEVWHASGRVHRGYDGLVRYTHDEHHLAAAIEIDESRYGGIAAAAQVAYAAMASFQAAVQFPQVLRVWNYFDAINEGDGDGERYRQFCVGRTAMRSQNPARRRRQSGGATVTLRCTCTGWRVVCQAERSRIRAR